MQKMKNILIHSLGVFVFLAILAIGISISATHIFIALSFIAYIIAISTGIQIDLKPTRFSGLPIMLTGLIYYIWVLITAIYHSILSEDILYSFNQAVRAELSDIALFLFGYLVCKLHSSKKYKSIIHRAFYALTILVIISGLVSVFSEFRLGRLAKGLGTVASSFNRPQHPVFDLFGITIYRPVGLMNTHLTYAGILIVCIFVSIKMLIDYSKSFELHQSKTLAAFFITLTGCGLLVINQARSIIFGFVILSPFLLYFTIQRIPFLKQAKPAIRVLNTRFVSILIFCFSIAAIFGIGFVLINKQSRSTQYTDYFRPIIWNSSYQLIKANPVFGIGPGNFKEATWQWRHDYLQKNPDLLYYFYNSPDGHAHNDLLHAGVSSGFPAMLIYLVLLYFISLRVFNQNQRNKNFITLLSMSLVVIALAGVFQCFYQDDEVIVLFWCIAGWLSSLENENRYKMI